MTGDGGATRVLVVDDDFMVAGVNAGYVRRLPGFEVVGIVHTGQGALELVDSVRPDLVLLDIYLPDLSGLEVLRRLRGAASPVDVLVVTAARDVDTVRAAVQGGVIHYLIKPFTFAALRECLVHYAEAHRRLVAVEEARQVDVDRMFGLLRGAGSTALPKGLSAATCELVAGALRDTDNELSASEVAERTGLSRVSARRYLEWLVGTGQAQLSLRYRVAGRPEHRYRWARTRTR